MGSANHVYEAKVSRVIDGRTIEVEVDLGFGRTEPGVRCTLKHVAGADYDEARRFLDLLVGGRRIVIATAQSGADGHYLVHAFMNGKDVNRAMIETGYGSSKVY